MLFPALALPLLLPLLLLLRWAAHNHQLQHYSALYRQWQRRRKRQSDLLGVIRQKHEINMTQAPLMRRSSIDNFLPPGEPRDYIIET
jgi:hypothetical protein